MSVVGNNDFTMLLAILFTCIPFVTAKVETKCSTCIKVDSMCHNITFLFNFKAPFREKVVITQLGIQRSRNLLYYAFQPNITDPEYYKVGYVNLDNPDTNRILEGSKPVTNFKTFAIDQERDIVYLGGGDAIYVLDNSIKAAFYSSGGDTIESISFYKNNLYFVRYGENRIVKKEGELFTPYEEYRNVKNFVIDKNNILVYMNTSGLYANKFNTNETVYLSKNNYFRGLTIDLDGVVYAWWIDGIYKVIIENDFQDSTIVRVAEVTSIGALTFDNDNNFLFSSNKGLFRLSETTNTTSC
ncbi:ommochrome-binding protein-like [Pectinophora gossypiella]|uniref:ommochrome-binding protein-like n=1 Tax=Pectinophora gossypiella TaxID=13191 RepID=UPI00214E2C86|nr:ommochrome-binding protein-like [Pectinophora gossypiella]